MPAEELVIINCNTSVVFATYQYWYKVFADAKMISEALSWKFQNSRQFVKHFQRRMLPVFALCTITTTGGRP